MAESQPPSDPQLRAIVMGVAGCGKTTIGEALSSKIAARFIDGDSLHPDRNVEKMAKGVPLGDDDRWPWLDLVGMEFNKADGSLIIGCSALKRVYRDRIRSLASAPIEFIHLSGARNVLDERIAKRRDHFMKPKMLDSQFRDLEPLQSDERGLVVDIDQPVADIVAEIHEHYVGETQ